MKKDQFLQFYEQTEKDNFPQIVGNYLDVEQYADLCDLILKKLFFHKSNKNEEMVTRYIQWSGVIIRTRKEKRYFSNILIKNK